MKISARQYAEGLYEAVRDKKEGEVKHELKNFIALLARRGALKKAPEIIKELKKIYRKKEGILEAEVVSAVLLKKDLEKEINGYVARLSGAEKISISAKVDPGILGGLIIKYEDKVVDASLKTRLGELKNKMVQY